jgi:hypothetical protein
MTDILLWKTTKIENAFYLQIAKQKFLGLPRNDKHGTTYWKFKEITHEKVSNQSDNNPAPVMDNIENFNQRQEKAEAINETQSTNSEQSATNEQSN